MSSQQLMRSAAATLLALLVALGWGHAFAPLTAAQAAQPAKIRVEITDDGFNGKPDGVAIQVDEGQLVELTFVFAQTKSPNDRHVIVLNAYGLETDTIDTNHREATLQFVANKPGTFEFKCDLDCDIHHHLKTSSLVVRRAGAGAQANTAPTTQRTVLSVEPSTFFVSGAPLSLRASLKDAKGAPVSKATVRFFVDAAFAGRTGKMEIGTAKTDANGAATLEFQPTTVGALPITAQFDGMGVYDESSVALEVQSMSAKPAYTVRPVGLTTVRAWLPRVVIVTLLTIWCTFGFVVYQAVRIRVPHRSAGQTPVSH